MLRAHPHPHGHRAGRRFGPGAPGSVFASRGSIDSMVFAAGSPALPGLAMPEPLDRRGFLISSALSALLHVLVIGGIALVGYYAKQAVEEIIPVRIFNEPVELPGSNEPSPLPVPKMLSAPIASAVPLAMEPASLAAVPAPVVAPPSLDLATPQALDLALAQSAQLAAQLETTTTPSAADITEVAPLDINAADLVAPTVELSGPTETASRTPTDLAAPMAFDSLADLNANQYKGAVSAVPTATSGLGSGEPFAATGVSAEYLAAGFAGGDPNAVGTVPCLQSAFVTRYQQLIDDRTTSRWEVPYDADADDSVTIRIGIDQSGSLFKLETVKATNDTFADSAVKALQSAAPFPPLNDNNRCLSEKTFIMTFNHPERADAAPKQ